MDQVIPKPKRRPKRPVDPDIDYKIEFQSQLAAFQSMGITEDEYVYSRRLDDGKESLHFIPTL